VIHSQHATRPIGMWVIGIFLIKQYDYAYIYSVNVCVSVCFRGSLPYGWTLADWLVFGKVRQAVGLDRCQFFLASAAPMMKDTLEFFHSLNIPIMEIYGMSECSGKKVL